VRQQHRAHAAATNLAGDIEPLLQRCTQVHWLPHVLSRSQELTETGDGYLVLALEPESEEMIQHIVLFRFRPEVTAAQIAGAGEELLSMKRRIAEIHDIRWAVNQAPGAQEYTHVLTVVLADMDAVQRYSDHPVHKDVVSRVLAPIREARLAVDIEVGEIR
jgi:hypothetical protein